MSATLVSVTVNAFAVLLLWTNPTTNEDGTPCSDLSHMTFSATFGTHDTLTSGPVYLRGREGLRDSVWFQLPPRSDSTTWRIWCVSVDTLGNVSDSTSNIVEVTR